MTTFTHFNKLKLFDEIELYQTDHYLFIIEVEVV